MCSVIFRLMNASLQIYHWIYHLFVKEILSSENLANLHTYRRAPCESMVVPS